MASGGLPARTAGALVALLSVLAGLVSVGAAHRTSATFDETVLVGAGVRGVETGRWEMVMDQPPLPMYAYGLAARGAVDLLPPETDAGWSFEDRWEYARQLFFRLGNDTAAVLGRARMAAAMMAGLLVAVAGAFAWWAAGPLAGVLGAGTTALLPDVLAHGGVAYNDLPLALFFVLAVWGVDFALRRPGPWTGAVAGTGVAAALAVKLSALALGPVAVVLLGLEAWRRGRDGRWMRDVAVCAGVALLAAYVALVLAYRGDATLTLFRFNFYRTVLHASEGHAAPAYLMGRTSESGFRLFFPMAFLFKTPMAFQLALSAALGLGVRSLRRRIAGGGWLDASRAAAGWRGRAALVGASVFGAFLLQSSLNAGFRYALPVLPLLAVAGTVVLVRSWSARPVRWAVAALLVLQGASTLSAYPHLLAYSSLWAGGRDGAHRILVDSSLDWGQGLLELRRFMDEEGVDRVRLSYFGSAPPEAYGIGYEALPSFFRLEGGLEPVVGSSARFTVISATNLYGLYLQGRDPFAAYRAREPYRVLGHTLLVFDEG